MKRFFLAGITCLWVCAMQARSASDTRNEVSDIVTMVSDTLTAVSDTLTMVTLQDVVVQGQRNVFVAQSSEFSQAELRVSNVGQNLPYLLQTSQAMVTTSDDGLGMGYTYFRLRGSDHTRINMTLNEIPLNDAESQTVFWVNITDLASDLRKVQVQRGVGTSVNGSSSFGGSINMLTLPSSMSADSAVWPIKATLRLNAGCYHTFREMAQVSVTLPSAVGVWSVGGRLSHLFSNGYIERARSKLFSYHFQAGWQPNTHSSQTANTQLTFYLVGGRERTYMAWYGVSREQIDRNRRFNPAGLYLRENGDTAYYDNQNDTYHQTHLQLHLHHRFNPQWSLHAALHYTPGEGYYEQLITPDVRQDWLRSHFYGSTLRTNYISEAVDIQCGAAFHHFICDHWGRTFAFDAASGQADYAQPHDLYAGYGDKKDANLYAKTSWRIFRMGGRQLVLYGDVQFRWVDYHIWGENEHSFLPMDYHLHYPFFNPKAGLEYTHLNHHAYITFAGANREPARTNFTQSGSTPPVPEQLFDYELGYSYEGNGWGCGKWTVGINGYWMDYRNQLVLTGQYSDVGACLTRNVPRSYRAGLEMNWEVPVARWLTCKGNVCASRNRIREYSDYVDVYDETGSYLYQQYHSYGDVDISFSPSWVGNMQLLFRYAGFQAVWTTQVVSRQYLDNTMQASAMLTPYSVTNLQVDYTLPLPPTPHIPKVTLQVQCNNLFNALYESNGGSYNCLHYTTSGHLEATSSPWFYPQAGIHGHAGVIIQWGE